MLHLTLFATRRKLDSLTANQKKQAHIEPILHILQGSVHSELLKASISVHNRRTYVGNLPCYSRRRCGKFAITPFYSNGDRFPATRSMTILLNVEYITMLPRCSAWLRFRLLFMSVLDHLKPLHTPQHPTRM